MIIDVPVSGSPTYFKPSHRLSRFRTMEPNKSALRGHPASRTYSHFKVDFRSQQSENCLGVNQRGGEIPIGPFGKGITGFNMSISALDFIIAVVGLPAPDLSAELPHEIFS
jgi:hypothetical protein